MKLRIRHQTAYRYANPVSFGPHRLMFRPRESYRVALEQFALEITPSYRLRWMRDLHENNVGLLEIAEPAKNLIINLEIVVRILEDNPFNFALDAKAEEYPFEYDHETAAEVAALTAPLYRRDWESIGHWLSPIWHPGWRRNTLELLQDLNKGIFRDIRYVRREQKGVQSPAETLERRTGSCRDFAALFMESCRFLGLASRFVSGYMHSDGITGPMSMHGWAETYLPGAGWLGFDPSWGILAASQYIPVAVTRHPEHAPPISGSYFGYPRDFIRSEIDLRVEQEPFTTSVNAAEEKGGSAPEVSVTTARPAETSRAPADRTEESRAETNQSEAKSPKPAPAESAAFSQVQRHSG